MDYSSKNILEFGLIQYLVLSSGSVGNSYAFYDGKDTIIIDQGLTYTGFEKRLNAHLIPVSSVKAIFLTHLHPDHSKGAGVTARKLDIPIYLSIVSLTANDSVIQKLRISKESIVPFTHKDAIDIGNFIIKSGRTYHDCPGSSFYTIKNQDYKIFLMTDTGQIPYDAHNDIEGSDLIFLESNYDKEMLKAGPYPKKLQDRISGPYGHLSNDEAAFFLKQHAKLRSKVYLIHLSDNNNNEEKVKSEMDKALSSGIFVTVCSRGECYGGVLDEKDE